MMYDHVRPGRRKHEAVLPVMVVVCVLLMAAVVGLFLWSLRYHQKYQKYVGALSAGTQYAYYHEGLGVQMDGETSVIVGENIYKIYSYITVGGAGRVKSEYPEEEPRIRLDYGDGSSLRLWEVDSEGYRPMRDRSVFLLYENAAGETYAYQTPRLSLETIKVNFLGACNNGS